RERDRERERERGRERETHRLITCSETEHSGLLAQTVGLSPRLCFSNAIKPVREIILHTRGRHLCVFTRIRLFVSLCVCVFECEREKDRVMGRQRERGDMQLNITRVSEGQYLGVCRVCWLCEVGYAHMVYTQPPELRV